MTATNLHYFLYILDEEQYFKVIKYWSRHDVSYTIKVSDVIEDRLVIDSAHLAQQMRDEISVLTPYRVHIGTTRVIA